MAVDCLGYEVRLFASYIRTRTRVQGSKDFYTWTLLQCIAIDFRLARHFEADPVTRISRTVQLISQVLRDTVRHPS